MKVKVIIDAGDNLIFICGSKCLCTFHKNNDLNGMPYKSMTPRRVGWHQGDVRIIKNILYNKQAFNKKLIKSAFNPIYRIKDITPYLDLILLGEET